MLTSSCAVSILVPICNVERYLRECLESICSQTLDDIQIICINDGSTDLSPQIIEEFRQIDSRIDVISKPNSGYGDSMNKGLDAARGEYIGIVESDDVASAEMFEELLALAKANDADVVKSNFFEHEDNHPSDFDPLVENLGDGPFDTVFCPLDHQGIFLWRPAIWSGLYKASFLRENGIRFLPTPGASFQDTSFNFKVFAAAKRAYLTKKGYLHYRIDNVNSSVKSMKKVFCICDEYKEIWRFAKERGLSNHPLCKLIPFIQYGGYKWNLDRLTPALQPGFYEVFIHEFKEIERKGLLERSNFNEASWNDLTTMLANPDGFYAAQYGPVNVRATYLLPLAEDRNQQQSILDVVKHLDTDDELMCAPQSPSQAFNKALDNARAQDKRVFNAEEVFSETATALVDLPQVRGERIGVVIDSHSADLQAEIARFEASNDSAPFIGRALIGYSKDYLESLQAPLFLSLLANGLYLGCCIGTPLSDWSPAPQKKLALSEYVKAETALYALFGWANNAMKSLPFPQQRALLAKISPLWLAIREDFRNMEYTDRLKTDGAPSPKGLNAALLGSSASPSSHPPALSVIIPVYNAQAFLQECLDSVLSQSVADIEVICVDDGSTDDSLQQLVERAATDPRIHVVSQVNGGAGNARNRGIQLACGRWLAFIDPDDYYPSDQTLEHLLVAGESSRAQLCGGSFSAVYPDGTLRDRFTATQAYYTFREEGFRSFEGDQTDYGWIRFIYRRDFLTDNGIVFPEMQWYEDPLFLTQVETACERYYAIPEPVYCYREDHKQPDWTVGKTRDLLKGIQNNLAFAASRGYSRLYTMLIRRLEEDYYPALVKNISDDEVFCRLTQIQVSLDLDLLAFARETGKHAYVLHALNDLKYLEIGNTAIVRVARKISESTLYSSLQSIREKFDD